MADHDNIYDDEELVSANPNQRNWRGILIALLVIIAVLALIVTSVILLTPPDEGPRIKGSRLKLSQVLYKELSPLLFNGSWVSNRYICYHDAWGGISLLDASHSNFTSWTLMTNETFRRLSPNKFSLSADHKYLLLTQNIKKLFHYSFLAQYTVYDLSTQESIAVSLNIEKETHPYLHWAQWTPQGHGLIIIQDYDIYYMTDPFSTFGYRITNSAVPGILFNGLPDWLYEEEILHSNEAVWMPQNSHVLLYASFNDTLVGEMHTSWYGNNNKLYPDIRSLRYPKPDTPNPLVTLYVADLADPKNIQTKIVKPPPIIKDVEHYFTTASWISSTEICITWMNRQQNISVITVCKSPLWKCQEIQRIISDDHGWVDTPSEPPLFSINGTSYITIAPVKESSAGYFKHIVWVNLFREQIIPLTHGKLEVTKILAWDQVNYTIYFMAIPSLHPSERHLYRVNSQIPEVGKSPHSIVCLSCSVTSNIESQYILVDNTAIGNTDFELSDYDDYIEKFINNENRNQEFSQNSKYYNIRTQNNNKIKSLEITESCQYHNVIFSSNYEYFVLECLGPSIPTVALYKTEMPLPRFLTELQSNTILKERIANLALPQIKTFPVQISGGYNAQVKLYLPPGLREDEITRYPLIVQVYGAPGTQLVTDNFKVDWNSYLSSRKNMIVAQIDGRGTAGQGYQLLHEVYNRLGTVEVVDQLEVTEYLRDSLHFVDKQRIAVWGWSYGGFIAAHVLAHPNQDVFHCGISIAPIVSWKHYDSAYTERYMGSPNVTSNYQGYLEADVCNKVENLRNKMFYLIHSTADNNVQFQHSMALAHHLAKKGILFRQQIYPDATHSLSGVKEHLYLSMAQFLDDCFLKQIPANSKTGLSNGGSGI